MNKDASRLVMVVEDDVSVRRPLVKFLEMHGFAVVTAETSDEGLDALKKHKLVAAVVDLCLRREQLRVAERARLFRAAAGFIRTRLDLAPEAYESDEKFVLQLAAVLGERGGERGA